MTRGKRWYAVIATLLMVELAALACGPPGRRGDADAHTSADARRDPRRPWPRSQREPLR